MRGWAVCPSVRPFGFSARGAYAYNKTMNRCANLVRVFSLALLAGTAALAQSTDPVRGPDEDVNSAGLRSRSGLRPDEHLLFNGWGLTPAGEHVPVSDVALKLVVSPDRKRLLAVHGGFTQHGLTVLDIATRKQTQFLPLAKSWNGLAFSLNGKQVFVSGGDSGQIHVFNYALGGATLNRSPKPCPEAEEVFLAGLAVHPRTGTLYVCNEAQSRDLGAGSELPRTGSDDRRRPASAFLALSAPTTGTLCEQLGQPQRQRCRHGQAAARRDITVGLRPNDMALGAGRPAVRGLRGRQHRPCHPDPHVEDAEAGGEPHAGVCRRARARSSPPRFTRNRPKGSTPDAVAVSPDGKTLFVANADNNSVMVVDISNSLSRRGAAQRRVGLSRQRLHPRRLVSDRGGGQPGQSDLVRRQRQRAWPRGRTFRPQHLQAPRSCTSRRRSITSARTFSGSVSVHPRGRTPRRWPPTPSRSGATRPTRPEQLQRAPSQSESRHPRRSRRAVPDQIRALHHQGEPHLRPGVGRLQGRAGQARRQRRSQSGDVRRGR